MSDQNYNPQPHSEAYLQLQQAYPLILAFLGLLAILLLVYAGWRYIRKDWERKSK